MVWNLSELEYDVDILDDQVLTYSFPGSPSPPLGLLLKLLISMESWLKADERNVAVVHCLTGKGRTSTVLAAFLCWMGEAGFSDMYDALEYIAACKQTTSDELTIPSQRRYASYFKNMLDGIRPSQPPLMLRRIIMSEAPRYAKGPPRDSNKEKNVGEDDDDVQLLGCVPYIQIFKAGKLLHTAPASLHFQQAENELPFCQVADGNISFHINLVVQGDILIRARHLTAHRKRVSMFRAAFHTGYVPPNVMRLTKAQLDGAVTDDRFVPEFFIDLIFETVDAESASKLLQQENEQKKPEPTPASSDNAKEGNADAATKTVLATTDDSMLHRDSRFWDVITSRMKEHATDNQKLKDPTWGPTVGRRRILQSKEGPAADSTPEGAASDQERVTLETFSIGGELDFLPETIDGGSSSGSRMTPGSATAPKTAPKKDSLMEALMGALDEDDDEDESEIVFEEVVAQEENVSTASSGGTPRNDEHVPDVGNETGSTKPIILEDSVPSNAVSATDEIADLLADANLNIEEDVDALLTGDGVENMIDLDMDDDEDLVDLESFLSKQG
jgi:tensin